MTTSLDRNQQVSSPASLRDRAIAVRIESVTKAFSTPRSFRSLWPGDRAKSKVVRSLSDVSLAVREGELFGILGPNGAGKSTLFRIIATSVLADSGNVEVCGLNVVSQASSVRRVLSCVMANERAVNWRLSARQNLALYAALYAIPKAQVRERVDSVLEVVDLAGAADRPVSTYSSGMKQRVMIGRALLADPKVLLLDEPTRSLDPVSARDLRRFIRDELVERRGCTVLLATHDGDEAFRLCDRVAILAGGKLRALDTAARLAQQFGDARIGVWTDDPHHPVFDLLVRTLNLRNMTVAEPESDGWSRVAFTLENGHAAIADVFDILRSSSARVARIERLDMSIAELISRVVSTSEDQ